MIKLNEIYFKARAFNENPSLSQIVLTFSFMFFLVIGAFAIAIFAPMHSMILLSVVLILSIALLHIGIGSIVSRKLAK